MTLRTRHLDCTIPNDLPTESHYGRFPRLSQALQIVAHHALFNSVMSNPTATAEEIGEEVGTAIKAALLAAWDEPAEGKELQCDAQRTQHLVDRYLVDLARRQGGVVQVYRRGEVVSLGNGADLGEHATELVDTFVNRRPVQKPRWQAEGARSPADWLRRHVGLANELGSAGAEGVRHEQWLLCWDKDLSADSFDA
jgi:hypothetical protein